MVWKGAELSKDPMTLLTLARRVKDFNHILAIVPWGTLYKLLHSVQTDANTEHAAEGLLRMLLRVTGNAVESPLEMLLRTLLGVLLRVLLKGGLKETLLLRLLLGLLMQCFCDLQWIECCW